MSMSAAVRRWGRPISLAAALATAARSSAMFQGQEIGAMLRTGHVKPSSAAPSAVPAPVEPAEVAPALQADPGATGRGLPAVVGLLAGAPDQHVGLLRHHVRKDVLGVAGLVAAEQKPGAIVPFDEDAARPDLGRKARRIVERR